MIEQLIVWIIGSIGVILIGVLGYFGKKYLDKLDENDSYIIKQISIITEFIAVQHEKNHNNEIQFEKIDNKFKAVEIKLENLDERVKKTEDFSRTVRLVHKHNHDEVI